MKIPFTKPFITGKEIIYIQDIMSNTRVMSGDGAFSKKVHMFIESKFNAKKAFLTTSCTTALEMATHLLKLKPGDEVIVPSYTFASTVNPIVMAGAKPIFTEINGDTLNIDPEDIKKKITVRTKAIYPVHYAGVACDMDAIMEIAQDTKIAVVEDAAQGVNAKYKDRYLGTIGDLGCYSFHDTKNFTCGEGGALLINNDDHELRERAEIMREKGTNRSKFFRGEVDKYTWVDIGSSYLPSDILAAYLLAQLEAADKIQCLRMRIWDAYNEMLKPFEKDGIVRLPVIPDYATHNAHMYYVLFNDAGTRDLIMHQLKEKGIHAVFHYIPLHSSPMGRSLGWKPDDLPITEHVSERLLRLPIFAGMTHDELVYTISSLKTLMEEL
jgi:dTDP-4-amino-4,6-dideoxygalactose transaminase